jgi:hypothetical protein
MGVREKSARSRLRSPLNWLSLGGGGSYEQIEASIVTGMAVSRKAPERILAVTSQLTVLTEMDNRSLPPEVRHGLRRA